MPEKESRCRFRAHITSDLAEGSGPLSVSALIKSECECVCVRVCACVCVCLCNKEKRKKRGGKCLSK